MNSSNSELHERIIEAADEYHFIAEEQWARAVDLKPTDEESQFEFRRLVRAALRFYVRALLVLDMVETDDEQELEDLLEILAEHHPDFEEFLMRNEVLAIVDEESSENLSRVFAVAETLRATLLEQSNRLAASLGGRF